MRTLEHREAVLAGYVAVTNPYRLPEEEEMLARALADFRGCRAVRVEERLGPEIWRHRSELKLGIETSSGTRKATTATRGPRERAGRMKSEY